MGQEPRTSGPAVVDSGDPAQIRERIETTRRELGETVEALAAKTDVKAQAKRTIAETKASVSGKKDEFVDKARELSPNGVAEAAAQVPEQARRHPLPLAAAAAFLAGLTIGRLTKPRQRELVLWPRR